MEIKTIRNRIVDVEVANNLINVQCGDCDFVVDRANATALCRALAAAVGMQVVDTSSVQRFEWWCCEAVQWPDTWAMRRKYGGGVFSRWYHEPTLSACIAKAEFLWREHEKPAPEGGEDMSTQSTQAPDVSKSEPEIDTLICNDCKHESSCVAVGLSVPEAGDCPDYWAKETPMTMDCFDSAEVERLRRDDGSGNRLGGDK